MAIKVFDVVQEVDTKSSVMGRNGHFYIKAVSVFGGPASGGGVVLIDAIGKSGKVLNASLVIDFDSFMELVETLMMQRRNYCDPYGGG